MNGQLARAIADQSAGRLEEAEASYREMLAGDPDHAYANNNLAILLRMQSRFEEAIVLYRRAIAAMPEEAAFRSNLVGALTSSARFAEALESARAALVLDPGNATGWFNLGLATLSLGDRRGAEEAYHRALKIDPRLGEAYSNLADLYQARGDLAIAERNYRAAISFKPHLPEPFANLGELLKSSGRVVEAIRLLCEATDRHPAVPLLHSNLLLALHYTPLVPSEVIWRAHQRWNLLHAQRWMPQEPAPIVGPDPERRLRIGYVSPDFCDHPVARFFEPLIAAHDSSKIESFCYAASSNQDEVTARIKANCAHWVPIESLSDDAAAARIRHDQIDILVDLAGHTANSRPLLFARKPAPVQVTWLGYPNTTGMSAIDYRLTDAVADPPGLTDRWHSERLVRLPHGFLSYQPSTNVPEVVVPPSERTGFITFGSFNNPAKLSDQTIALWAKILKRLPNSRMLLKGRAFKDREACANHLERFARFGVDASRIELEGLMASQDDHFRAYGRMDIALDTMPYNGTTTTCEALWMGVPVVTMAGDHHVARVSTSILTHLGLPELIAAGRDDYVERALALASDPVRLADYRRALRTLMREGPIMDHHRFAQDVEAAYRMMWRNRLGVME
jgi:predicted O-linked N-acetylglucosamine transferase (SPINDLY family)